MDTTPTRGRGRPRTIPNPGRNLRCVVTPEELAEINEACKLTGMTQQEFARRAVVEASRQSLGLDPPNWAIEEAAKNDPLNTPGVYLIRIPAGPCKIGCSLKSIKKRLASLKTGQPHQLTVVWFHRANDPLATETELHKTFADKRLNGEWFDLTDEEIQRARNIAESS